MLYQPVIVQRARTFACAAALVVVTGGMLTLLGWYIDNPVLKSGGFGPVAMNPATAVLFEMVATALAIASFRPTETMRKSAVAALSALVSIAGFVLLANYFAPWDLALDRLLFRDQLVKNRMAPNTALQFILLGVSLLTLDWRGPLWRGFSQVLALLVASISAISLIGHAYGARQFYGIGSHIPMAFNTATLFAVSAVGLLSARPERSVFGVLTLQDTGGIICRRLLPAAIVTPIVLGFFRVIGQRAGLYDTEFGAALMVVVTVGLLVAAILMTAALLSRTDAQRKAAEEKIHQLNRDLEQRVQERTAELCRRDDQLRQSQKMEAIGQLAGGVAHDFNNLLTIILGYSGILGSEEGVAPRERKEMLGEIHKAAERAALLTRQLLAFSRKQILEPRVIDLNEIVNDTQRMLRRLIGEDISIHTKLTPNLDRISADPGQIEQVVMNLVVNARDAMPQGGELGLETANVELDDTYSRSHADVKPGRYVVLVISDSGCGMDEATKAHIFEPFFTTKRQGKGTGLGLATVYGIVRQSGGHIWVYSELGQGTTFKIYFPAVTPYHSDGDVRSESPRARGGDETVLLVEDEDGVRALSRNVLQMYGYKVLAASSPSEAIRLSQLHRGGIDMLLTDIVMPEFNGKRLAELLLPQRPEMKVLYMSGYTDDAIVRQGVLDPEVNFVQKPFTPTVLANKVRDVLDGMKA